MNKIDWGIIRRYSSNYQCNYVTKHTINLPPFRPITSKHLTFPLQIQIPTLLFPLSIRQREPVNAVAVLDCGFALGLICEGLVDGFESGRAGKGVW